MLDGETDIQGTVLQVDGLIKSPVSVADLEPEPEPEDPAPPPPPPEEKKGFWDNLLDGVQLALDVVGMIPGVGEIADLANAGISLARGDYEGAALSLAACVPFAGWAATGTKFVKKGMNAFETGKKIVKAAENVIDTTKTAMNAIGEVVGKVYTSARNVIANGIDKVADAVKLMKQQMKSTVMAAKKDLQKKVTSIKKNVKQGLDNLRNKLSGPSKEFVTPEGIKFNIKEVKGQAHKIELPKNEVQQNYLKVMKEMEEEAAARAAKGPGNGVKNTDDVIEIKEYSVWNKDGSGKQKHHLNQDAAYGSVIPTNKGVTIELEGDIVRGPVGTPHYKAHQEMEKFWDQFRKGTKKFPAGPRRENILPILNILVL
ncbi:hypothetical protein NW801_04915 [Brevibacillus laterosporus]|uniref:Pre-toxin TG domain-containing protein n=1 Tax=Brevibacillus halotolerans TaxID=1507437 RepID=A0ABT4HTN2_9BACL|nr:MULTISPECIES: hypothetical protein [Brevibacillus]MCR8984425.1 hypothetical protein [Brevibacillus laterosporus]MCZ0830149.1 hypothetical protein [Brevibacillus halotolerans]